MTPRTVHLVVPEGIEDRGRPSGGNTYDRRLCQALRNAGWSVGVHPVAGTGPAAGEAVSRALQQTLAPIADGSLVLVDGLVASGLPEVLVPASGRLRVVVLLHMPFGQGSATSIVRSSEEAVLSAAGSVVVTSHWTREWVLGAYRLDQARVHVAPPGVDIAGCAPGSRRGGELVCVAAVSFAKGHDVLVEALSRLVDLPWRCVCVGPLPRACDEELELRRRIRARGLEGRVLLAGPRTGSRLDASYAAADLLVLASRAETFGMVVTEALARGIPVVASDVGGVGEALGSLPDGSLPGLLVPAGDPAPLAAALRRWLEDSRLRGVLRDRARERRAELTGWGETADRVAAALRQAAA